MTQTAPHVYPEPTLLDACEARYGPIDWDALPTDPPFDATYAELEREDRAWASDADADFAADREWGRRHINV